MQAVILAGGFGKRLRPLTNRIPKPMIKINGKPIIGWQIEWLKKNGVSEIIVSVGYKKEHIINYLKDGKHLSIDIRYVSEDKPLGTGGGLKNVKDSINNEWFYVINGDILTNIDLSNMKENKGLIGCIAVVPLQSPFGIVSINEEDSIVNFVEKPRIDGYWVNAGIYYFNRKIFSYLPDVGNIEYHTFPSLAKEGMLKAVKYRDVYWRSIDSLKDIEEASNELISL